MTTAQIIQRRFFTPNTWIHGSFSEKLTESLEKIFGSRIFTVNSGRSSIYLALKTFDIGEKDEVIIQAYTCNSVPNPILWSGATPVYVDIEADTLNIDPSKIEAAITERTKAILVQHTFGRPADLARIGEIAKSHNLVLIEDCAHALGGKYKGQLLGTFGDAAIFSFDREKGIRALAGGFIVLNKLEKVEKLEELHSNLPELTSFQVFKILNNYLVWRLFLRQIVSTNFGKRVLNLLNKTDFFNVLTTHKENLGERPSWHPSKMPNLFAETALAQLSNINTYNLERTRIAKKYAEKLFTKYFRSLPAFEGTNLKLTIFNPFAEQIRNEARKKGLWFGNWYNKPVYPEGVDLDKMNYRVGSCPNAELASQESLNLPNHIGITEREIEKVVSFINSYANPTS